MHQTNEEIAKLANAAKTYAWGSGGTGLGPFMDNVCAALEQLLAEKAQLEVTVRQVSSQLEHGKELLRQEMRRATERGEEVLALRSQLREAQGDALARQEAVHAAVSAIYFDDNHDYRPALVAVVTKLDPALAQLLEHNEREALAQAEAQVEAAKPLHGQGRSDVTG